MKIENALVGATRTRWMIVDDNSNILFLLSQLAAQMTDAEIGCFNSPHEASAAFAEAPQKFQLVITDLEMPGMDGIQLCRRMRLIAPEIKVLLSSGSQLLTAAEAIQFGFCGLVRKPCSLAILARALASAGVVATWRKNFSATLIPA